LTTIEVETHAGGQTYGDYFDRLLDGQRPIRPKNLIFQEELALRLEILERLSSLPDNYRCALLLKQGHGLSVDRTAVVMGVSQASVRSVLYRARQALRDL